MITIETPVPDDLELFHRVPPNMIIWDLNVHRYRPTTGLFRKKERVSIYLADKLAEESRQPVSVLAAYSGHHLAASIARTMRESVKRWSGAPQTMSLHTETSSGKSRLRVPSALRWQHVGHSSIVMLSPRRRRRSRRPIPRLQRVRLTRVMGSAQMGPTLQLDAVSAEYVSRRPLIAPRTVEKRPRSLSSRSLYVNTRSSK